MNSSKLSSVLRAAWVVLATFGLATVSSLAAAGTTSTTPDSLDVTINVVGPEANTTHEVTHDIEIPAGDGNAQHADHDSQGQDDMAQEANEQAQEAQ